MIPSELSAARDVEEQILSDVAGLSYDEGDIFAIKLALEEALNNACRHGNGFDPDKRVTVEYDVTPERFVVRIADEGDGFDPDNLPDPTAEENLEKPSGRGVMLMRVYMDDIIYNDAGNVVTMVKQNAEVAGS